jgi:hypothetical protein
MRKCCTDLPQTNAIKNKFRVILKRYQYTAIDDATRIRALKIYPRHTQENAIRFVNYVMEDPPVNGCVRSW